jgi:signal transduction histidine kinase
VLRLFRHGTSRRETGSGVGPSFLVLLSLLALLMIPTLVDSRADRLRNEIEEVTEPAVARVAEIRYLLARQSAALSYFLLTGESSQLDHFSRLSAREAQLYPEVEELAIELTPQILAEVVELRTLSDQWHQRIRIEELSFSLDLDPAAVLEEDLYLRMLAAAGRADLALRASMLERRQEIRRLETIGRGIYVLLLVLAVGAAVAVLRLNARIRGLAAEALARRVEVERALDETARAIEARSHLIRGFTHDVKNPLGAADGFAELLQIGLRGELSPPQAETVQRIRRSIRGAMEIIDELLDLSRLESGGLRLERERVEVDLVAGESVRRHAGAASGAGIEIDFAGVVGPHEPVAYTDADRIRQILDNLLSNAIKYTPAPGRVEVAVGTAPEEIPPRPGRWLTVTVTDTGPGIAEEEHERIFDEFHRVPGSPGRGHGLGLAISRRIARLLGGDITLRSAPGEGSTFILWVSLRGDPEHPGEGAPAALSHADLGTL